VVTGLVCELPYHAHHKERIGRQTAPFLCSRIAGDGVETSPTTASIASCKYIFSPPLTFLLGRAPGKTVVALAV
jgi:hypothetical protein